MRFASVRYYYEYMLELERELVKAGVNAALRAVRLDEPEAWLGLCPPYCSVKHTLADTATDHKDGPLFVFQTRVEHADNPTIGVIVCGHSRITDEQTQDSLAVRLSPKLAAMTFKAILSPEIDTTLAAVYYNHSVQASSVELPLVNDGQRLHLDVDKLEPDVIGRAALYLL